MTNIKPDVSLFIPCLIDQVYPEMGIAMVSVLKKLGIPIKYNRDQTCCGQPAFNAGHHHEARQVAAHFIDVFKNDGTIICPSGSCTAMVRNYYSHLFENHQQMEHIQKLKNSIFEFSEFLTEFLGHHKISGIYSGRVGFHHSCHSYRELEVGYQAHRYYASNQWL